MPMGLKEVGHESGTTLPRVYLPFVSYGRPSNGSTKQANIMNGGE